MQAVSVREDSRKLRLFRLAAGIAIMMDAITRIGRFLFGGARPIDRTVLAVDFLVLCVIAVEFVRNHLRERRTERRERQRGERVAVVQRALSAGRQLEQDAPDQRSPNEIIANWKSRVNSWLQETQTLLRSYSAQAEASFLHDPHSIPANYQLSVKEYGLLVIRLNNLRGIMERPEVYL